MNGRSSAFLPPAACSRLSVRLLFGVGVGRILRLRTGRPAVFPMTLGAGLVLAAVVGDWRHGPPWWLLAGGVVAIVVGLTQPRTRGPRSERF